MCFVVSHETKGLIENEERGAYLCDGELKVKLAHGLCGIVGKGKGHVDGVAGWRRPVCEKLAADAAVGDCRPLLLGLVARLGG